MNDTWEIRSRFEVQNPSAVRYTLSTTAQLKEWQALCKHLDEIAMHAVPVPPLVHEFRSRIKSMVNQATQTFWPESKP